MNERIHDLAIQAKDWAYADHDGYTAQMLFEQKFAELIVRECAKIAGKAEYSDTWLEPVEDAIKKHFGVE
jgi:hypothetical protein